MTTKSTFSSPFQSLSWAWGMRQHEGPRIERQIHRWTSGDSAGPSKWTCPKLNSLEGFSPSTLCLLQNSNFNECHHHLPSCPSQKSGQHSPPLTGPSSPHLIDNQVLCNGTFQASPAVCPLLSNPSSWSRLLSSLACSSTIASWLSPCLQDFVDYSPFFSLQPA